jgi:hypothetical protein
MLVSRTVRTALCRIKGLHAPPPLLPRAQNSCKGRSSCIASLSGVGQPCWPKPAPRPAARSRQAAMHRLQPSLYAQSGETRAQPRPGRRREACSRRAARGEARLSGVPVLPKSDAAGLVGGHQRRALRAPRGAEHAGRARVLERGHDCTRALGLLRARPARARAPSACCGVRAWLCAVGNAGLSGQRTYSNVLPQWVQRVEDTLFQHAYYSGLACVLMPNSISSPSSPLLPG